MILNRNSTPQAASLTSSPESFLKAAFVAFAWCPAPIQGRGRRGASPARPRDARQDQVLTSRPSCRAPSSCRASSAPDCSAHSRSRRSSHSSCLAHRRRAAQSSGVMGWIVGGAADCGDRACRGPACRLAADERIVGGNAAVVAHADDLTQVRGPIPRVLASIAVAPRDVEVPSSSNRIREP